jgi:hypothetical protein
MILAMVVSCCSEAVDHVREHNAPPAAAALLPGEQARDGCSLENRGWSWPPHGQTRYPVAIDLFG